MKQEKQNHLTSKEIVPQKHWTENKANAQLILAKALEKPARTLVIAAIHDDGSIESFQAGLHADHILIGALVKANGLNAMMHTRTATQARQQGQSMCDAHEKQARQSGAQ